MPVLLFIGLVFALLLLAWAAVGVNYVYDHWTLQFWFGVASVLVLAVAVTVARWRKANERVPLRPAVPPLPPAVAAVPEKAALRAAPELTAVAAPDEEDARPCEGPGCPAKVNENPWTARVAGETEDHVFCSRPCAEAWHGMRRRGPILH